MKGMLLCFTLASMLIAACGTTPAAIATPTPSSVEAPTAFVPPAKSWILVDLPPEATQLQYGAEVYRLACSACHAYDGQGLTAAWRATWAPADQNCWQSKCHGPNHPPDGFQLPIAPPVTGKPFLSRFATAQELYDYIQLYMPWQDPRSLPSKDSWAVTAFVLRLNQIDPGKNLGPDTAGEIQLR